MFRLTPFCCRAQRVDFDFGRKPRCFASMQASGVATPLATHNGAIP
jgi:hypothetical protein